MTLVSTVALLEPAYARGGGLAAIDVSTLEQAEGAVLGAEQAGLPVILQVSQDTSRFHLGDPAPFAAALAALARTSLVEVSLHLDHVTDTGLLHRAAECGFSSVLFDAGPRSYAENVTATAEAVAWGHAHGLLVEAELGYVVTPDEGEAEVESAHLTGVRTDPDQARAYVAATGLDALAVAVGLPLDLDLVADLAAAVPVPLVLHGTADVPQPAIRDAVTAGLTTISFATLTTVAMTRVIRRHLHDLPDVHDPRQYLAPARQAVSTVVAELVATVGLAPVHDRSASRPTR